MLPLANNQKVELVDKYVDSKGVARVKGSSSMKGSQQYPLLFLRHGLEVFIGQCHYWISMKVKFHSSMQETIENIYIILASLFLECLNSLVVLDIIDQIDRRPGLDGHWRSSGPSLVPWSKGMRVASFGMPGKQRRRASWNPSLWLQGLALGSSMPTWTRYFSIWLLKYKKLLLAIAWMILNVSFSMPIH